MRYRVSCDLAYEVRQERTPLVFNIEAQQTARQSVAWEELDLSQAAAVERFTMPGTSNRYFRILAEPGLLKVRYDATVDVDPVPCDPATLVEVPAGLLPLDVLTHLNPSRYVESDLLAEFARREFGNLPPGHGRVAAICDWIHRYLSYAPGSSDAHTSVRDTLLQRRGVCRDYAHLAIAFCRALDIPARFVSAYACRLSPQDFHAVLEAWLEGPGGGTWFAFDPSRMASSCALVRIGTGRDASEAAFCTAFGDIGFGVPSVRINAVGGRSQYATGV